ncbi:hypothetical protein CJF30_00008702 [Rutstroemia sp. NJR-2017a BBW]|nr:hypothetical protein CJF30_00008702 [Rutstroemia sp. NJR-2017a BBW]
MESETQLRKRSKKPRGRVETSIRAYEGD